MAFDNPFGEGMRNLVSVVIPCFNQGQFLGEAVESALRQSHSGVEVIIVDDGSLDNTREVALSYGSSVNYIFQKNAGLSVARNTGILASEGSYIQFLDADDRILPSKFEEQVAAFQRFPDAGVVYSEGFYIDADGKRTGRVPVNHKSGWVFHEFLALSGTVVHAPLVRRECFAHCGLFDPKMKSVEDADLWLRIAQKYQFQAIPQTHFEYRVWGNTMSKNWPRMLQYHMEVLRRYGRVHGRCEECRRARRAGAQRWVGNTSYNMMIHARECWQQGKYREALRYAGYVLIHNPYHFRHLLAPRYLGTKAAHIWSALRGVRAGQVHDREAL